MKKVTCIITAYNEEDNVIELYSQLESVNKNLQNYSLDYLFIENGSSDNTFKNLLEMKSKNNKLKYSKIIPKDILENVSLKQKKSFTTNVYEVFAEKNGFIGDYKQSLNYTSKYIYDKT